jgi:hypothetical protein
VPLIRLGGKNNMTLRGEYQLAARRVLGQAVFAVLFAAFHDEAQRSLSILLIRSKSARESVINREDTLPRCLLVPKWMVTALTGT